MPRGNNKRFLNAPKAAPAAPPPPPAEELMSPQQIQVIGTAMKALLGGGSDRAVILEVMDRCKITRSEAAAVVAAARAELQEQARRKLPQHFALSLARLELLFRCALDKGDMFTALSVEKTRIALLGLEPPKELRVTGEVGSRHIQLVIDGALLEALPLEQRRALLEALRSVAPVPVTEGGPG